MPSNLRLRAGSGVALVLACMAAVEVFALRNGTIGLLAAAVAGLLAVVMVITRFDLVTLALATTAVAAFTLTWNGWFVGPVRPGDFLALLAVLLFVFGNDGRHIPQLPVWVWQLVAGIVLVVALNLIFPPSDTYVAGRTLIQLHGKSAFSVRAGFISSNIFTGIKFIIAVAAIPAAFAFAALYTRRYARRLIVLFAVGGGLSGWVAIAALYGVNTLNLFIGTHGPGGRRQIGLANQPNYLAAGAVLAVPVGVWMLVEADRRSRLLGAFVVSGCVLGTFASGSRGGAVTIVFTLALSIVLIPRARRFVLPAILATVTGAVTLYLLVPSVVESIGKTTRLFGSAATHVTGYSDLARSILAHQALRDFAYSPIHGIGLQVSFDAQTVYLQLLQSGGLLLMFSLMFYNAAAIVASFLMIKEHSLAAALCASVIASLALDVFEADLTDRFYYVPVGGIIALRYAIRQRPEDELVPTDDPRHALPPPPMRELTEAAP